MRCSEMRLRGVEWDGVGGTGLGGFNAETRRSRRYRRGRGWMVLNKRFGGDGVGVG